MIKKQLLTHGLFLCGLLIITVIVHYPTFISGKTISQHDILQGKGGNEQLQKYRSETGEEALWNPNMFSGMPAYLTGVKYRGDILVHAHLLYRLYMPRAAGILFASFLSFYVMMLVFGVRPWIAFAAAIAFGLNGFNIIGVMAGHNAKIDAVAYMPLVVAGVHLAFGKKRLLGVGLTALGLALQIKANHPQITYYLVLIIGAYGINELVKTVKSGNWQPFGTTSGLLLAAAVLAIGANYGRLAATLEYSKYSIRGKSELSSDAVASSGLDKEYAFRYSNGIMEPLFLLVPNFFGGSSQQELSSNSSVAEALRRAGYNRQQINQQIKSMPTYWGNQPLTAPYYAGTITVFLFILGIFLLPKEQKIWLMVLAIIGIVLSWGKNFATFNDFLFNYLPGYNKFRSVTFTIIITIFSMNLLGFIALEKLFSSQWDKNIQKKFFIAIGITGGFLLLAIVFAGALGFRGSVDAQLPDWFTEAIRSDRKSLLVRDALRALLIITLMVTVTWLYVKSKLKGVLVFSIITLTVFLDSFFLSRRFIKPSDFVKSPIEDYFEATNADTYLMSEMKPGDRVLNLQNPFNENRTSYFHASLGGYHGAKIRRYQDLIDQCIQNEMQQAVSKLRSQSTDFSGLSVINMLNTRFFYAGTDRNAIFENTNANGPAWIVREVLPVNSADEEINKVCNMDTRQQATIDQTKFAIPGTEGYGSLELVSKTPNKVVYSSNTSGGASTGIFSEIYYPEGWTATMDGKSVDIIRANYVLRALEIPPGQHEIVFEFKPTVYATGNAVMAISGVLILLLFVGTSYISIRSNLNSL